MIRAESGQKGLSDPSLAIAKEPHQIRVSQPSFPQYHTSVFNLTPRDQSEVVDFRAPRPASASLPEEPKYHDTKERNSDGQSHQHHDWRNIATSDCPVIDVVCHSVLERRSVSSDVWCERGGGPGPYRERILENGCYNHDLTSNGLV